MPRRSDPLAELAAAARGDRVTLYGVDPVEYARRMSRTIDQVDGAAGDGVVEVLTSIAGYRRDLAAALAYEQRKGLASEFRIDNAERIRRQIADVTNAWVQTASGLTEEHYRKIADMGFDYLPDALAGAATGKGVPAGADAVADLRVPSVSRRQLAAAFGGYQADLVQNLGKMARDEITGYVRAAIVGELSPGAVMSKIRGFLDTPERGVGRYGPLAYQAERVVRTETMRVFNAANEASTRFLRSKIGDDGTVEVWNHSSLPGARANHAALDGFAIKAGGKFTVAGVECSGPHDPALPAGEVINCRCSKFIWNERWGTVPRGARPQGTAFFDSARAQRNGWVRGDRAAGLGSAGPGEGGEDFGKNRGKGTGPGPTPPPPGPKPPPIIPPKPEPPMPPAITPKPPGQVVVGNQAAGAKPTAKPKAYDPTKEYRPAAEVRAAVLAEAGRRREELEAAAARAKEYSEDRLNFVSDIEGRRRMLADYQAMIAGKSPAQARDLQKTIDAITKSITRTEGLAAKGITDYPAAVARAEAARKELADLREAQRKAIADIFDAKDPAQIGLPKGSRAQAENKEAWTEGMDAFGRMFDRRALNLTHKMTGTTTGDGSKATPFGVKFVHSESRANYDPAEDRIKCDRRKDTVVHELGHWIEEHDRSIHRRAADFLFARAASSPPPKNRLQTMNQALGISRGYSEREVTFPDRFEGLVDRPSYDDSPGRDGSVYAGKSYSFRFRHKEQEMIRSRLSVDEFWADWDKQRRADGAEPITPEDFWGATEIVSMAAEAVYRNPAQFAEQDPEYFDWFYNLTKGFPWP